MKFIKPNRLKEGDTVAIVAPSSGAAHKFPHIYESGIKTLQELGIKIKEYSTARASDEFLHKNPKARAEDLNNAFKNQEVRAIISTIGGDDSVRILPFIDTENAKKNPKIIMGLSDTTTILTYYNQAGLVTYYGPSVLAGLSQAKALPKSFVEHIREFLFNPPETYKYKPYEQYSDGYPDWSYPKNKGKINEQKPNDGFHWLQGSSVSRGILFGGCFAVMEMMKSTEFWPEKSFWKGKILFLETPEEKPKVEYVKWMLRNYGMQDIYDKINGLLIGRARDYSDKEKEELDKVLVSVVADEFGRPDLPVISNMDFGHTDPQFILPLGIKAEINCKNKIFRLVESPLL